MRQPSTTTAVATSIEGRRGTAMPAVFFSLVLLRWDKKCVYGERRNKMGPDLSGAFAPGGY